LQMASLRHWERIVATQNSELPRLSRHIAEKEAQKMNDKGILLETGTNEVEILELLVGGQSYGVNVLKVKQIISYEPKSLTQIYGLHAAVKGIFLFRNKPVPMINLSTYFGHVDGNFDEKLDDRVVVICEFNQSSYGFLVDGLTKIYRISWDQIQSPPYLVQNIEAMVTGVVPIENREIMIMDLESIVGEVVGEKKFEADVSNLDSGLPCESMRLIIADDSALVRQQISQRLEKAGFTGVCVCANGQEAYDQIVLSSTRTPNETFDVLITDIEMPVLDGLTLCKKVKSEYPNIKVLILPSLITDQMIIKCEAVGADAHLSKAELKTLIPQIETLFSLVAA
jgi:two-component system chemotaxis response regulator CheV